MEKTLGNRLLANPEGLILVMGLGLVFLFLVVLGLSHFIFPGKGALLLSATIGRIALGRIVGMYFGYAIGLGHKFVIPINMGVDAIGVLIVYPLFVLSLNQALNMKKFKKFFDRLTEQAKAKQDWVQKYGKVGLFLFVFFPLWGTGPVVGSVIGFLMNLRTRVNLSIVLSATFLAIGCWAWILSGVVGDLSF